MPPEPILTTSLLLAGYTTAVSLTRQGTAVSKEAENVRNDISELVDYGKQSYALYGSKVSLLSELFSMAKDCKEPNWDGYGAEPVDQQAVENAKFLIESLPDELPLPECSIEPDGEIAFDWMPAKHRTLSVSIGSDDRLAYAWVDGTDSGHAVAKLEDGQLPSRILSEIERFSTNGSSIWAA